MKRLYGILSKRRTHVALAVNAVVSAVAFAIAFLLRFEFTWNEMYGRACLVMLPVLLGIRVVTAYAFGVSRGRWRFVGIGDVARLSVASAVGSLIFLAVTRLTPAPVVPLSIIVLEGLLTVYVMAGVWMTYRAAFERLRRRRAVADGPMRRVLVIGAGEAGNLLTREMLRFPTGYWPVGFVDDDPAKWGTRVQGLEVIGPTQELATIAARIQADELFVAMPSAEPHELRRIVACCEATGLPFKMLPGIQEVLSGNVRLNFLREVRIEDLLGRDPVQLELPEIAADIAGRVVLITGAAGSIGSELARQAARYRPALLILLDQAESDLFFLEMELRERDDAPPLLAVVADVADPGAVERVFRQHAPERVYHAAAYKHVPLMESNAAEAIRNNVGGTWRVADAAGRHGCGTFVLVSTDKAVRPASVMGATKRVAELIVMELQREYPNTNYCAVRFGNVLGSNGSVVPIFRRQIEAGKPLTVTHPEATRYFMTIPEAVQLILHASVLPEVRGRIAMLDMGEPVRIAELAANMLRLSGSSGAETSSRLVFTGLRPGEKLHEELAAPDEETMATSVAKVRVIRSSLNGTSRLLQQVAQWDRAFSAGDAETPVAALRALFPTLRVQTDTSSVSATALNADQYSESATVGLTPAVNPGSAPAYVSDSPSIAGHE